MAKRIRDHVAVFALPVLLWFIKRYFLGRAVVQESQKAAIEGKIVHARHYGDELQLVWIPTGGTSREMKRLSLRDLRRAGKEWVFDAEFAGRG